MRQPTAREVRPTHPFSFGCDPLSPHPLPSVLLLPRSASHRTTNRVIRQPNLLPKRTWPSFRRRRVGRFTPPIENVRPCPLARKDHEASSRLHLAARRTRNTAPTAPGLPTRPRVYRVVHERPARVSLQVLTALCDIF